MSLKPLSSQINNVNYTDWTDVKFVEKLKSEFEYNFNSCHDSLHSSNSHYWIAVGILSSLDMIGLFQNMFLVHEFGITNIG